MSDAASPFVVPPGEGTTVRGPVGGPATFKARGETTDGEGIANLPAGAPDPVAYHAIAGGAGMQVVGPPLAESDPL